MDSRSDPGEIFDGPAAYQITVQGTVAFSWSERLEGMVITHTVLQDGVRYSMLTGELYDQAALAGVLNTIYELHLPLIAVHKLSAAGTSQQHNPGS